MINITEITGDARLSPVILLLLQVGGGYIENVGKSACVATIQSER
ncbi:hypothetical protein [Ureibacillus chungkukjangi]|nr:hypothetical protein [Ureibacillus chungkukjangi]